MKQDKGRQGTVEAVLGVDLEVSAGEIFGFMGPTGRRRARAAGEVQEVTA